MIKVARGDSKTIQITVRDKFGDLAPFDLTGAIVYFTVKKTIAETDASAVIAKTSDGGGITIISAANGEFDIELTPGDTSITPMEYVFDVRIAKSGSVYSMEEPDIFKISPVVRRAI